MAYEGNPALARVISKALREEGLKVSRGLNDWTVRTTSSDGGVVALECKMNDDSGEDIYLWVPPQERRANSSTLKSFVHKLLRTLGLRVGT